MKILITVSILIVIGLITSLNAEYVHGYIKKNGQYVSGYHRTKSNDTKRDNYTTKGNINPYTFEMGKKEYKDYKNTGKIKSNGLFDYTL